MTNMIGTSLQFIIPTLFVGALFFGIMWWLNCMRLFFYIQEKRPDIADKYYYLTSTFTDIKKAFKESYIWKVHPEDDKTIEKHKKYIKTFYGLAIGCIGLTITIVILSIAIILQVEHGKN